MIEIPPQSDILNHYIGIVRVPDKPSRAIDAW